MFRTGRVASVNKDKHTARVTFFDSADGGDTTLESGDLPVLVTRPGDYALPAKDALVVCAMEDGPAGIGYVLGAIYSAADAPPLGDADKRAIAGEDIGLGVAGDDQAAVALAPAVDDNFDGLKQHFDALEAVLTGPAIPEPGNGSPSALQVALKAAIQAVAYPAPGATGAENVTAS